MFNKNNALENKVYDEYGRLANAAIPEEQWYASNYIAVEYGTTYIRSSNGIAVGNVYNTYDIDKNFIERFSPGTGVPFTISNPNVRYITFALKSTTTPISTYQLNVGTTALPFEPHGYKVPVLKDSQPLTPIYLSQQLMAISSGSTAFKDEYNSSGTATYIVKKKVFDGTESIGFNQLPYCILSGLRTFGLAFCTHFKFVQKSVKDTMLNGECTTYLGSGVAIWFCLDNITSADDFKAFLAQEYANGTPVTVYYVLATAETESVTAPTITTTGGEVSIDVDTTVKPSEMSLTYHGWHTHEPLKRENGQWF